MAAIPPGGSQPEISSPGETQGAPDLRGSWGWRGGKKSRCPWRECAGQGPAAWAARTGKAQNAGPTESAPWWGTREPEPERLRPGRCTQRRARSCGAAWSLSSVDGKAHTPKRRQAQCPVTSVCSAPPSPQHAWTSEPEQETTSAPLCQGGNHSSVQSSRSVVSHSLWRHESQHARPPCPSPIPGVYSNSCPSSRWCHPAISSSVVPFSSCPQSLPASGSFPIRHYRDLQTEAKASPVCKTLC